MPNSEPSLLSPNHNNNKTLITSGYPNDHTTQENNTDMKIGVSHAIKTLFSLFFLFSPADIATMCQTKEIDPLLPSLLLPR